MKGKPAEAIDYAAIAHKTPEFSGADLEALIDVAIEAKLEEAMRKGVPSPLTTSDLAAAAAKQKSTTKEWFTTGKNYALFANEGGLYDDILNYLKLKR